MGEGKVLSRSEPRQCEYRTLSSYFLKTKTTLEFMWDGVWRAINAFNRGLDLPDPDEVQNAINNSDTDLAKKLIDAYHLLDKIDPVEDKPRKKRNVFRNPFIDELEGFIPKNAQQMDVEHPVALENADGADFDEDNVNLPWLNKFYQG